MMAATSSIVVVIVVVVVVAVVVLAGVGVKRPSSDFRGTMLYLCHGLKVPPSTQIATVNYAE